MGKVHNGGYKAATGFKRESAEPLTDDVVWEYVNDLKTIPKAYEGMCVYVIETQLTYFFKGGLQTDLNNWITVGNQVPEPTTEGSWVRQKLGGIFSWVSLPDWITTLKNNLSFWKSDALVGQKTVIATIDSEGQIGRGAEIINDNAYVDDLDLITPTINATYNQANNYTAIVTPTSNKVFEAGRYFVQGNYKYEALVDDNTITRVPLKQTISTILTITAGTTNTIQSDDLKEVEITSVIKLGVSYLITDTTAGQTTSDVYFNPLTGSLEFTTNLSEEKIQITYNRIM